MRNLIVTITILGIITATSLRDIYDTQWALIIGIDKYHNEKNLEYAVKDAEAIRDLLISHFGYSKNNITLLRNDEATLQNIKTHLGRIANQTKKNDAFLVFYAGHGITKPTHEGGEMGYLLPVDGNQNNAYATCLPMNELKSIGSISHTKHLLFLMDACYGGLMAVEYRSLDKNTPGWLDKLAREKSRQIITAGGKGEQVMEKGIWGHSAFTKNLLNGLKNNLAEIDGDGFITANELAVYLKKRVTIDSENKQTPQIKRYGSDEGEFIFFNHNKSSNSRSKSSDSIPNRNESELTLSQFGKLENLNLSIGEWSNYKERDVRFEDFISYKQEIKSNSGALIRSIILPGWGQYYTGNTVRGVFYSSFFILGVMDIVLSPALLNIPPLNDPQIGLSVLLVSGLISYGIAPLDAMYSVENYNKKMRKKYNITISAPSPKKPVSVNLTYSF